MIRLVTAFCTLVILTPAAAEARPRALTIAEWREDLAALDGAIRQTHPNPFARVDENDFATAVADLKRDIPRLSDQEIVLRLAEIAALCKDGHTRLALPREQEGVGLEFGHTKTEPPGDPRLRFAQLPVAFEKFADGLFVVAAAAPQATLIGSRVLTIGDVSAEDALAAMHPLTHGENGPLRDLIGADLLSLPEALFLRGVAPRGGSIKIRLADADGGSADLTVRPMAPGAVDWKNGAPSNALQRREPDAKAWSTYLADRGVVYAKINEIADARTPFAVFAAALVRESEEKDARLVIDLRDNFGGDGDLNRALVLAILRSEEINRFGRLFVLTGPRTFSAAQLLVNQLERYTRALFVGEPTGARPDHFGDSKRFRLKNSELTLRVSTLHWSSLIGVDKRETTNPDYPAPTISGDYFAGRDAALDLIAAVPPAPTLRERVGAALERGDHYQVYRHLADVRLSPESAGRSLTPDLIALGAEFERRRRPDLARFAYLYGQAYDPENAELKAALDALPQQ